MSVARVTTVTKSMKPLKCEKCDEDLPKGSAYRHFKVGFRSHYKHVRCMKPECTPRESERESSLLAGVYAAQEAAHDALDAGVDNLDDIRGILTECAEGIREVATQYADSAEAMGEAGYEMQERADTLESSADELEQTDVDTAGTVDCGECNGTGHKNQCSTCEGTGTVDDDDCPDCDGDPTGGDCEVEGCDEGQVPDFESAIEAARDAINEVELP